MLEPHDHEQYAAKSSVICVDCGKNWDICAYCNESWHNCTAESKKPDSRLPPGYRVVKEFPDYMVNNQASVRHIPSQRYCMLVRVSKTGGAMINLRKDGKTYTKAAQEIRDAAFTVQRPSIMCGTCNHHPDSHFKDRENCLRPGCTCSAYLKQTIDVSSD
jgi:hypothetical protein